MVLGSVLPCCFSSAVLLTKAEHARPATHPLLTRRKVMQHVKRHQSKKKVSSPDLFTPVSRVHITRGSSQRQYAPGRAQGYLILRAKLRPAPVWGRGVART